MKRLRPTGELYEIYPKGETAVSILSPESPFATIERMTGRPCPAITATGIYNVLYVPCGNILSSGLLGALVMSRMTCV